jgi:hypothetical protein
MKNLVTENRDAQTATEVVVVDPRTPTATILGTPYDFSAAAVYIGTGTGAEPDPAGTPTATLLFKQELPDLVVEVGSDPVTTPVVVVGTWRDVNLPTTLAEIVAAAGVFDLNPWDYDAGLVGAAAPSYELAPPPDPPPFTIGDGVRDALAISVAGTVSTMSLYAALHDGVLYVATEDAGEGSDHFLLVAAAAPSPETATQPAPWGKAGVVGFPAAAIFLADENDSSFAGWFNLGAGTLLEDNVTESDAGLDCDAAGGVLEGMVDLAAVFGAVPTTIYLAVGPYGNADGGALYAPAQAPVTADADGDIDYPAEVAAVAATSIEVTP